VEVFVKEKRQANVDAYGITDVGKKRDTNQDQFLISDLSKTMLIHQTSLPEPDHQRLFSSSQGKLFIVADGLGGHGGGEVASAISLHAIVNYMLNMMPWFFRLDEAREDDLREELEAALQRCQGKVQSAAGTHQDISEMGTTLTMAYVIWPRLYVVHAGDSRCYLYRSSKLEQITKDHTIAEKMVDQGKLTPEEAEESAWSNVLWNAVGGGSDEISPEVYKAELQKGDILLLCTDGLTKHLSDGTIVETLTRPLTGPRESVQAKAQKLIDMANQDGGTDNITVVIAQFS
jgi:protein phosphatase